VTRASLQRVLDHIQQENWPADLVAMTGDLTQDESVGSYRQFKTLFSQLEIPVYTVPGNHDVRPMMQTELNDPPYYYCASVVLGNWLITGIDSCVDGKAGGHVTAEELERLKDILQSTDAEHALVCLHHPPMAVGSRWLDGVGLENGREFLDAVLSSGNTRAAIFGHVHQTFDDSSSGIRILGTPSTCRQFMVGSDEFALDDNPPAYRHIILYDDGSLDTDLIWLDE
jgi:Icc protein